MAAATNTLQLSADEIDDILYLTRTNDAAELLPYLSQLAQNHGAEAPSAVLEACVEEDSQNTAFHYAAANGSTELLQSLLKLFADSPASNAGKKALLNRINAAGNTPLHWAALNGHAPVVQLLTESGADVWVKNAAGNLPVFEAERAGKDEVVAVLLLAGGKEVEEQLKHREGNVSREEEREVGEGRDEEQVVASGSGSAATAAADEAAEKLQRTGLDG